MSYTYEYPRPEVTADVVVITKAYLTIVDEPLPVMGLDDAAKAEWFPINALPALAFDHDEIMADAISMYNAIRNK